MFFAHLQNIKDRGLTLDLLVTPKCDILANSEDPDEMHAFHLGHHYFLRQKGSSEKTIQ